MPQAGPRCNGDAASSEPLVSRGPVSGGEGECTSVPPPSKSTCCMSLLMELRYNYPVISVFSGSETDSPFYSLCIPKLFIHHKISKRGLKQFFHGGPCEWGPVCVSIDRDSPSLTTVRSRTPSSSSMTDRSGPWGRFRVPHSLRSPLDSGQRHEQADDDKQDGREVCPSMRMLYKQGRHLRSSVWCIHASLRASQGRLPSSSSMWFHGMRRTTRRG